MPEGRREVIQFEAGTGLGVRVSASGQISFIVQLRLKDGSRWRETLGAYGKLTIEAARDAAQALAGDIAKGVDPRLRAREAEAQAKVEAEAAEARLFTVRALVERWRRDSLSTRRPGYAVRAYRGVEQTFKALLDTPAAALTRADVRKWLEQRRTPKTKRSPGRGARFSGGPAAVRNAAASLHAAYRWALGEELIDQDPLNGLKLPARTADRERVLTTDETRRIYAAAGRLDYPAQQFIRLLLLTGCRRAEIAGLRWDEIMTEADGARAIVLPPARTKTKAGHHVPLSAKALEVIAECAKARIVGSPYVLTSDGWRQFANFSRVKLALDEALGDIADWRLHDFRRTIVSILARKPFRYNPVVLDLLLGHQPSQLSPVARIYQQEKHHDDRCEALEAWAKHLTEPPATVSDLRQERARSGLR
jgi:integrase